MFKSLRCKTALLFTLCFAVLFSFTVLVQTVFAVIESKKLFDKSIQSVFSAGAINEVIQRIKTPVTTVNEYGAEVYTSNPDNAKYVYEYFLNHSAVLGLGVQRSLTVLGNDGVPLYSSDNEVFDNFEVTPAVSKAMLGEASLNNSVTQGYSDYAVPLTEFSGKPLVVYVRDTNDYILESVSNSLTTGIAFLICGIFCAFFIGMYLSHMIVAPIKQLNRSAKKLASGDMNIIKAIGNETELKELSTTITDMAETLEAVSEEAKKEQNKLETILQNMTDGILAFNLQGRLIHINHEAQRILNRKYLDNANFDTLFKELKAGISMGDLLYIKHDDEIMERQVVIEKEKVIRMTFTTFSLDNKIGGIVVVLRDITSQEKLEQARRNFVADVSHELRTPLTTIKSYSETLMDVSDSDHELTLKFLNVISSEADRMVRIISDLLTLSQLDAKHTVYKQPEPIDVRKMLESVTDKLMLTAKKKDQTLVYSPINEVPQILGDRDGLERVIVNIIGNALKYTQTGGRIDVFSSKVYNDICIKVADNGIGIPSENLPHIFDRFYRVDKARSRETGGTGLGLAIAKQTIETAFSGKIIISSEYKKGTEVIITIPLEE